MGSVCKSQFSDASVEVNGKKSILLNLLQDNSHGVNLLPSGKYRLDCISQIEVLF